MSVADSAGLRPVEAASEVEREGIRRVLRHACDAVVYLIPHPWRRAGEDEAFLSGLAPERLLLAASLADLPGGEPAPWAQLRLSSLTGAGVGELREAIVRRWIDDRTPRERDVPAAAFTPRQREILERASATAGLDALRSAYIECLRSSWPPVDLP
ncbi:MAG: hypothetical protein HY721_23705 [Planctomycetes bacterium]|nr:hypothetical protein [Planctomycetota bacterium]